MADGNKTLLWVGLGCAGVSLLGVCVVGGIFVAGFGAFATAVDDLDPHAYEYTTPIAEPVPVAADHPAVPDPNFGTNVPSGFHSMNGGTWAFAVPLTWDEITAPAGTLKAARSRASTGNFATNVNLTSEPFSGDVASYAVAGTSQLRTIGATVMAQTSSTVDGRDARDIEATFPRQGRIPAYRTLQRFAIYNSTAYVITCTASQAQFERYRSDCMQILGTLDFL